MSSKIKTRRQYLPVAQALNRALDDSATRGERFGVRNAAHAIADALEGLDPTFDSTQFLRVARGELKV